MYTIDRTDVRINGIKSKIGGTEMIDGLVQNLLGYESTDDMLAHLESSLENYSKEALLYQAVAESLDITPTQEQLDAYSDYKDTYGQNYCTMVALMDAVTDTLTSGAVVS